MGELGSNGGIVGTESQESSPPKVKRNLSVLKNYAAQLAAITNEKTRSDEVKQHVVEQLEATEASLKGKGIHQGFPDDQGELPECFTLFKKSEEVLVKAEEQGRLSGGFRPRVLLKTNIDRHWQRFIRGADLRKDPLRGYNQELILALKNAVEGAELVFQKERLRSSFLDTLLYDLI